MAKIVTFYSYKGGTGRSMALANVAWILACAGKNVLVLDWDLEAPGVHRYFRPFLTDPDLFSSEGIIDFFTDYSLRAASQSALSDDWSRQQADLDAYTTSLNWSFPSGGGIDFVPAGRQGPEYSTRVNTFDWKGLYERFRGATLIEALRAKLTGPGGADADEDDGYDYVLIDSRTGVSDTSGICTLVLPSVLAACYTMNNQSIQGLETALSSIKRQREEANRPLRIFPLPMRIDLGEADRLEVRRKFARQVLEPFLSASTPEARRYWDQTEVLGVPIYSYEEVLAPFRDSGGAGSVLEAYRHITRYLTGIQIDLGRLQPSDEERNRVLANFAGVVSDSGLSLANKAEQLFQSFAPEDRDEFRRVILRLIELVSPGKDQLPDISETRLKPKASVLLASRDVGIITVIAPSADSDRGTTYRLADRNLLWSWPRLVDWISRERKPANSPPPPLPSGPAIVIGSATTPYEASAAPKLLHPERWGALAPRYSEPGPRRILALDGGGVRSLITLEILYSLEQQLSEALGGGVSFRLCDYFDYIGGTSTGAILAAGLALGMSVSELMSFYREAVPSMFEHSRLLERVKFFYSADPLKAMLEQKFGTDTTLEPDNGSGRKALKSLLLVVTKNVTTDSPWTISSNPDAKYSDPALPYSNLRIPLWQLVRASTAAPIFYPPETIQWDPTDASKTYVFVDGGVTPYNNPAFLLYRMATEPAFRLNWKVGERNLLVVSIGTGTAESPGADATPNRNIVSAVSGLAGELMYGSLMDQDINCRTIGRCTFGPHLDREMLDLVPRQLREGMSVEEQYAAPLIPLSVDLGRRFLYVRYTADISRAGLAVLGFPDIDSEKIQRNDGIENTSVLMAIGQQAARAVNLAHLGLFVQARGRTEANDVRQ